MELHAFEQRLKAAHIACRDSIADITDHIQTTRPDGFRHREEVRVWVVYTDRLRVYGVAKAWIYEGWAVALDFVHVNYRDEWTGARIVLGLTVIQHSRELGVPLRISNSILFPIAGCSEESQPNYLALRTFNRVRKRTRDGISNPVPSWALAEANAWLAPNAVCLCL